MLTLQSFSSSAIIILSIILQTVWRIAFLYLAHNLLHPISPALRGLIYLTGAAFILIITMRALVRTNDFRTTFLKSTIICFITISSPLLLSSAYTYIVYGENVIETLDFKILTGFFFVYTIISLVVAFFFQKSNKGNSKTEQNLLDTD